MTREQSCLEIDAILLLITLHDIEVFDIAATKSTSDTDDGIVFCSGTLSLLSKGANLRLQRYIGVDNDVLLGFAVCSNIHGDRGPSTRTEAAYHGFAKGSIAADNQTCAAMHN